MEDGLVCSDFRLIQELKRRSAKGAILRYTPGAQLKLPPASSVPPAFYDDGREV